MIELNENGNGAKILDLSSLLSENSLDERVDLPSMGSYIVLRPPPKPILDLAWSEHRAQFLEDPDLMFGLQVAQSKLQFAIEWINDNPDEPIPEGDRITPEDQKHLDVGAALYHPVLVRLIKISTTVPDGITYEAIEKLLTVCTRKEYSDLAKGISKVTGVDKKTLDGLKNL